MDKWVLSIISDKVHWIIFIGFVFLIKGAFFCLDPLPMFFLGDSMSYIATALKGWIPPDRSFTYGFIIRLVAVYTNSLTLLVLFQVILSALAALIATYSLERFFCVRKKLAFTMGILCAVGPLQLLYERYVLTETVALFIFSIYVFFSFKYLEKSKLFTLIIIPIIGTALISIRLSFLPIVLFFALFLPLLNMLFSSKNRHIQTDIFLFKYIFSSFSNKLFAKVLLHSVISISVTFLLLSGYRHLNGILSNAPPAYQYESGFFLLADWAPVVKPVDFPYPNLADSIINNLQFNPAERNTRSAQRWMAGGLIANIKNVIPNSFDADTVAKQTAINALKRDPLGIIVLALRGFTDYWDKISLNKHIITDRGGDRELPSDMLTILQDKFYLHAKDFPTIKTFTRSYYDSAWPWYLFLLCTPFLALISFFRSSKESYRYSLITCIAVFILIIIAISLIERPTVRYLHALEWLLVFSLGPIIEYFLCMFKTKKQDI